MNTVDLLLAGWAVYAGSRAFRFNDIGGKPVSPKGFQAYPRQPPLNEKTVGIRNDFRRHAL